VRLVLDNHYPVAVAARLRATGFDVVTASELHCADATDAELLTHCTDLGRALLTNNAVDLVPIARQRQAEGRAHAGIVLTSDTTFPRHRNAVAPLIEALTTLLTTHHDEKASADRVMWLVR
jgi:predicted nuclease of predicted toxin-antitoxin system